MPVVLRQARHLIQALSAAWRVNLETPIPASELAAAREAASIPSYGTLRHSFKMLGIWVLLALVLSQPLSSALHEFAVGSRVRLELHRIQSNVDEGPLIQVRYIVTRVVRETAHVMILGTAPEGYLSSDSKLEDADQRIFRAIQPPGIRSMDITFRIAPVEVFGYRNVTTSSP